MSGGNVPNGMDAKWAWVKNLGHAIIKTAELYIGGQRIDLHNGDWNHVWHELTRPVGQERGYNKITGNLLEHTILAPSHDAFVMYIPLNFFFCRHTGLSIPLIALQYHDVELVITFEELQNLVITSGSITHSDLGIQMLDSYVCAEFVYLDTDERRRFAQESHTYLIEAVQFTGAQHVTEHANQLHMNFNHCVKELVWFVRTGAFIGDQRYLWYHPSDTDALLNISSKRLALALAKYNGNNLKLNNGSLVPNDGLTPELASLFDRMQAVSLSTTPSLENVSILGDTITLQQASTPISTLLKDLSTRPIVGHGGADYDVVVRMPYNFGLYLDGSGNPLLECTIVLNGTEMFASRDAAYFNYIQPLQHHTNTPSDGVNVYSFALRPEEHQPSSSLNFSRIDTAVLKLTHDARGTLFEHAAINMYAHSYNQLRIESGMGGLSWSN